MPDIMNLNLDAFADRIREFAKESADRIKQLAEESIAEAKQAMEGAEQIRLIPELLKDAVIAWVGETTVPKPFTGADPSHIDGGRLEFFGFSVPQSIVFSKGESPGNDLPPGRYRFFVVGFPVEFPSDVDSDGE